ncbi:MAG: carboxypeptidase-like regulatory domain-containing protein [Calditrichia bacterium]
MYTSAEKWCRLRKVCWFNSLLPIRENSWQKACPKTEIDLQSPNILLFFQMLNLLKIRCSIGVALALCAMILPACVPDAPRLNPFDPGSGSEATAISGRVFTYYEPRQPLAGVLLRLQPLNIAAVTDAAGNFSFANVPAGDYQLIASGENWSADTTSVSVSAQNLQQERTFFLNALPRVSRYRFFSEHIDRIFRSGLYPPRLSVIAEDPTTTAISANCIWRLRTRFRQLAPTARVDSFTHGHGHRFAPENSLLLLLLEYECNIILFDDPGAQVADGRSGFRGLSSEKPLPLSRRDSTQR